MVFFVVVVEDVITVDTGGVNRNDGIGERFGIGDFDLDLSLEWRYLGWVKFTFIFFSRCGDVRMMVFIGSP